MSERETPSLEEPPPPFEFDVPLVTPERIWNSVLALLCAGIVAGSIVYSLANFNVAEQAHAWQTVRTQEATEQFGSALRNQIMNSGADDVCSVDSVLLIHMSGDTYDAYVDYSFTPTTVEGANRHIDTRNMTSFQCQMTATIGSQSLQWNLDPVNPDCEFMGDIGIGTTVGLISYRNRIRLACYGQ